MVIGISVRQGTREKELLITIPAKHVRRNQEDHGK